MTAHPSTLRNRLRRSGAGEAGNAHSTPRRRGGIASFARQESRLLSAGVLLAAGVALVMLGWYGAAHTNILTEQIPYLISGGLLGLGLIVVAGILAASAASEREARALRRDLAEALSRSGTAPRTERDAAPIATAYFVLPGGRSYHVAGCPLLEGKEGVTVLDRAPSDLAPCKLCSAD